MADNVALKSDATTTIATAASDDIGGVQYQRTKLSLGADGSATDALGNTGVVGDGVQRVTLATDVALPAGTNAIGKLASNAGVTIGAVEIAAAQTLATVTTVSTVTNVATIGTSVTPGTAAGNLGKAEDAAHTTGDTGVMALAVRNNTASALATTDGDYIPLTTNTTGHLWVDASGQTLTVGSHAVTNAGTFVVQENGALLTSSQLIDDMIYTDDTSTHATGTSKGALMMGVATPTDTSVDANDIGAVAMTTDRQQLVRATVASGGVASGAIASGAIASGAVASGAFASGSIGSGAIASGAIASGAIAAGAIATGATSIAANEDDASANLDTGVKILFVQKATPADTGGTDGDYMMPQMSAGRVWTASILPSGAVASGAFASGSVASGAFASGSIASGAIASGAIASGAIASGAIAAGAIAAGATSIADNEDVASADGDRGVKMLVVRKATPANTSGTDGDYEFPQINSGYLWVHDNKGLSNLAFSATFTTLTRPANTTAYTAADSISDNATAGSVTALSATIADVNDDPIFISEILISSTDTGLAGKKIRAYLFNSDPTSSSGVVNGDNAAYSQKKAGYIGAFMGFLETGFSDGTVGRLVPSFNETNYSQAGGFIVTKPTSGAKTLYIQYQAVEAFTPSANSTTIIGTARGWQGRAA